MKFFPRTRRNIGKCIVAIIFLPIVLFVCIFNLDYDEEEDIDNLYTYRNNKPELESNETNKTDSSN
jgi:hypothetical protein